MSNGVSAPGSTGPGARPMRLLSLIVTALLAGCGQQAGPRTASASTSTGRVSKSAADRAACTGLVGRLEQVTQTLTASSELIANSLNKQQLTQRIAEEASQLRQAADLMARGPVPAPLVTADRNVVAALHTFTDDFTRAGDAAGRGDFHAAVDAMTDEAAVQRIVDASKTIEDWCR